LYGRPLRFESPSLLMAFFADLESRLRIHLRHIEINQYVKKDAKTALAFLAEAKNLNTLRIETGMAMDDDTAKVAKAFWLDASKLLEAVGSVKEKMMVEDKPKPQAAKPKDEASSDEESSSEDEEGEDSEGEEEDDEDEEEEAGDEETKESKVTTSSVAQSEVVHDGTVNPANLEISNNANETDTIVVASAGEDIVMADNNGDNIKTDDAVKKDSKSPAPVVATKKIATPKPSPKLRQGRKADAVDILQFGKAAFKYKDEGKSAQSWDASMRAEFLDALRAKLK
jgi:hypothetical protein